MWWGVAAALLANALYSVGFVLEKRALTAMPSLSVQQPFRLLAHVLRSPLWMGGAIALAAGFGAQLLVYRTLPIAAAQGIFVSGLVLLVVLSARLLGERTTGRERFAIAAILLALVMVVLSLKEGADRVSVHAPTTTVLLVCVPSLSAGLWLYAAAEGRARNAHRLPTSGVEYGVAVGLLYGVSSLAIKGVSSHLLVDDGQRFLDRFLDLLISPYPYLLCCTGVFGLIMSAAALQRSRASLIVPVCTTVTSLFTAVLGTLAFGEPLPHDPVRLGLRIGGTVVAVVVLVALPRHDAPASADEGEEEQEEEAEGTSAGEDGASRTELPPKPTRPTRRPPPPIAPSGRTIGTHLPRRIPPPTQPPRPSFDKPRNPRS